MQLQLTVDGKTIARELDVPVLKMGGSKADDFFVAGLRPTEVRIRKKQGQIWVTSRRPGQLNGMDIAAHATVRVLPGECVTWDDGLMRLAVSPPQHRVVPPTRLEPVSPADAPTVVCPSDELETPKDLTPTPQAARSTVAAPTRIVRPWGTFTYLNGTQAGRVIPLTRPELIVGRGEEANIKLNDSTVSKRQARIAWDGELAWLECLSKTNATLHNGESLKSALRLDSGSVLTVGHALLRFELTHARQLKAPAAISGPHLNTQVARRGPPPFPPAPGAGWWVRTRHQLARTWWWFWGE